MNYNLFMVGNSTEIRHRSNLMNVRSYTGANVDSDHYLVYSLLAIIFNAQKFRGVKTEKMECDQTL